MVGAGNQKASVPVALSATKFLGEEFAAPKENRYFLPQNRHENIKQLVRIHPNMR